MPERRNSVAVNVAVKALYDNYRTKTSAEIAEGLGMTPNSFYQKINQARGRILTLTSIYQDPDDESKTATGDELISRLGTTWDKFKADKSQIVVQKGTEIPKPKNDNQGRSTNGSKGLLDLIATLVGENVDDAVDSQESE